MMTREVPSRERSRIPVERSAQETLVEIGRFGVSDPDCYRPDLLGALRREKALIVVGFVADNGAHLRMAYLTEDGRDAARYLRGKDHSMVIREDFRTSHLEHELAVHRRYCAEVAAIEEYGGRVIGIRTEAEFLQASGGITGRAANQREAVERLARDYEIKVIDGKLRVPDVRIVYEIGGERQHVDLEIASAHIGSAAVKAKIRAGMSVSDRNHPTRIRDDHNGLARMLR